MITVYISQPMTGRKECDIIEERGRAAEEIMAIYGKDVEICDSYRTDIERENIESTMLYTNNTPDLYWLGESIRSLSWADVIWFCDGWEHSRGCKVENMCATLYDIEKSFPTDKVRLTLCKDKEGSVYGH